MKYKTGAMNKNHIIAGTISTTRNVLMRNNDNSISLSNNKINIYPEFHNNICYINLNFDSFLNFSLKNLNLNGFEFKVKGVKFKTKKQMEFFNESITLYSKYKKNPSKIKKDNNLKTKINDIINKESINVRVNNILSEFALFFREEDDGIKIFGFRLPGYYQFLNELTDISDVKDSDNSNLDKITSRFLDIPVYNDSKNITLLEISNTKIDKEICVQNVLLVDGNGRNIATNNSSKFVIRGLCNNEWDKSFTPIFVRDSSFEIDYYKSNKVGSDFFSSYICKFTGKRNVQCECQATLGDTNYPGFTTCNPGQIYDGIYSYQYTDINDVGEIDIILNSGEQIFGQIDYTKSTDDNVLCDNNIGDINGDGILDVMDVATLITHLKSENGILNQCTFKAADMNGDGMVNILDLIFIIKDILAESNNNKERDILNKILLIADNDKLNGFDEMDLLITNFIKSKSFQNNKYTKKKIEKLSESIKLCGSNVSVPETNCTYTDVNGINDYNVYCNINNLNLINNPSKRCK